MNYLQSLEAKRVHFFGISANSTDRVNIMIMYEWYIVPRLCLSLEEKVHLVSCFKKVQVSFPARPLTQVVRSF